MWNNSFTLKPKKVQSQKYNCHIATDSYRFRFVFSVAKLLILQPRSFFRFFCFTTEITPIGTYIGSGRMIKTVTFGWLSRWISERFTSVIMNSFVQSKTTVRYLFAVVSSESYLEVFRLELIIESIRSWLGPLEFIIRHF